MQTKEPSYLSELKSKMKKKLLFSMAAVSIITVGLLIWSCGENGDEPISGEFRVLNYNVWGLPEAITNSEPERRISLISPLLNDFEIVLVQEDFWYHHLLSAESQHPYRSEPSNPNPAGVSPEDIGDGLNRFSLYPISDMQRVPWPSCNGTLDCGSDCLAIKGYSFGRHEITPDVSIDVYNLHNESGRCPEDYVVRANSTDMMLDDIARRSAGRAVIVAGDFNLLRGDSGDDPMLEQWLAAFRDVCEVLECSELNSRGRREVTYISDGDHVKLTAIEHALDDDKFYDADGRKLSNHPPQWARIGWRYIIQGGRESEL